MICVSARPADRLHPSPASQLADPPAEPGLLDEVVRHAAFGSVPISRADNQLTGRVGASLDFSGMQIFSNPRRFSKNAKFSCAQVAHAHAVRAGGGKGQLGRFDHGGVAAR
jgi:hypothetical protein